MNASTFLQQGANPQEFTLGSTCEKKLSFQVGPVQIEREHRHANALGKSLMIVREMLQKRSDSSLAPVVELQETIQAVLKHLKCHVSELDFSSVEQKLSASFKEG